ncbi:hypothetical protein [Fluviicola taffensis]|uniref:hypothetical protein n=1 Tax=Fluviicola taffensis TaxID=191579 RepID=UPI00313792E8
MNASGNEFKKNPTLITESRIKIEKPAEFEESIFNEVYRSAKQIVLRTLKRHENYDDLDHPYNNIIAFTGERGKGKSSAMISFHRALKSIQKGMPGKTFFEKFFHDDEPKYRFISLGEIDPSLFRGKESLFEIVLAKMFGLFKESLESNNSSSYSDEDRRELVKHFQNVFENLKYTTGNHKDELYKQEALDSLIKLSTSSNLYESFQKLVNCYLRVLGTHQSNYKNFLVIAIDDFDLKIEGVYEMLEDLRQFLISRNVIILISCKMEQIQETVLTSIYSSFFSQLGQNKELLESIINESELNGKAEKYVSKLVPLSRRIVLPDIDSIVYKKRPLLNEIPKQVLEQLKIYVNPDLFNAFYPETLREFNSFEKIAGEDLKDQDDRLDYFKHYLAEKLLSIKLNRNLSELLIGSSSKNYMTHFKRILQKLLSDLNPPTKNSTKNEKDTSASYPEIIRLYRQLLTEIPKYETNLQKLVSLYRTYFNILYFEAIENEKNPYFKIYDEGPLFPIPLPDNRRIKELTASKAVIYSFGEPKTEFPLQDSESDTEENQLELSPPNWILYHNAELAQFFNLDLAMKYFDYYESAKKQIAPRKSKNASDTLSIQLSASKDAADILISNLSFSKEPTKKGTSSGSQENHEENESLEKIKKSIRDSKFYAKFSDIENFLKSTKNG